MKLRDEIKSYENWKAYSSASGMIRYYKEKLKRGCDDEEAVYEKLLYFYGIREAVLQKSSKIGRDVHRNPFPKKPKEPEQPPPPPEPEQQPATQKEVWRPNRRPQVKHESERATKYWDPPSVWEPNVLRWN